MPAIIRRNKENCCAITGHRDIAPDFDIEIIEAQINELVKKGITAFYCGMARGFDLLAAQAVLNVKNRGKEIELVACIPCAGQEKYYPEEEKKAYGRILKECDEINYLSENYFDGCMLVRDRFMVDNCDTLLAYLKKRTGGTFYTYNYALSLDKEIVII